MYKLCVKKNMQFIKNIVEMIKRQVSVAVAGDLGEYFVVVAKSLMIQLIWPKKSSARKLFQNELETQKSPI